MNPLAGVKAYGDAAWPCKAADELAEALIPVGERRRVKRGDRLFSSGDTAEGIYLIVKGTARATLPSELGGELVCQVAGAGSVLGLPSALCSKRFQFDVEALEPLEAVFLPTAPVNEILRQRPDLCLQAMGLMCDELKALKQRCDQMNLCRKQECCLHGQCKLVGIRQ